MIAKPDKKEIKAVFLDLDLTLVDSMPAVKESYRQLSRLTNRKPDKEGFKEYIGNKFSDMVGKLHEETGIPKKKIIKTYHEAYMSKLSLIKNYGKKIIPKLKKEGIKTIILTNNHKKTAKKICEHLDISYDDLITDEDMEKTGKKHDAMKRVIKKMKIKPSEALYAGDHINDIKEARKAGVLSAVVPTGVFKKSELEKHNPDIAISSLDDLAKMI